MNEMYQLALELLRTVEDYHTDGTEAEQAMADHILNGHSLPALVHELHKIVREAK